MADSEGLAPNVNDGIVAHTHTIANGQEITFYVATSNHWVLLSAQELLKCANPKRAHRVEIALLAQESRQRLASPLHERMEALCNNKLSYRTPKDALAALKASGVVPPNIYLDISNQTTFYVLHRTLWPSDVTYANKLFIIRGSSTTQHPLLPECREMELFALPIGHPAYDVTKPHGGLGVRAKREIKANARISLYAGMLIPDELAPPDNTFRVQVSTPGMCIDATHMGNLSRFINDARRTGREANVAIVEHVLQEAKPDANPPTQKLTTCEFKAIRDINPGEELLVDYGPEYWAALQENAPKAPAPGAIREAPLGSLGWADDDRERAGCLAPVVVCSVDPDRERARVRSLFNGRTGDLPWKALYPARFGAQGARLRVNAPVEVLSQSSLAWVPARVLSIDREGATVRIEGSEEETTVNLSDLRESMTLIEMGEEVEEREGGGGEMGKSASELHDYSLRKRPPPTPVPESGTPSVCKKPNRRLTNMYRVWSIVSNSGEYSVPHVRILEECSNWLSERKVQSTLANLVLHGYLVHDGHPLASRNYYLTKEEPSKHRRRRIK